MGLEIPDLTVAEGRLKMFLMPRPGRFAHRML